jgi:hypothetical protein
LIRVTLAGTVAVALNAGTETLTSAATAVRASSSFFMMSSQ